MELTQLKTWTDLSEFIKALTPEQLLQPVKMWGDEYGSDIHSVEILDEDYINPSGDGCEPVSSYLNEDDDYSDEPVIYKAGTIMLNAFEDDKKMHLQFVTLFDKFLRFSLKTFKNATAISSLAKLEEEADEVADIIAGKDGELAEEYADCLMCILDSAARMNIMPKELLEAFEIKLKYNKTREWVENPDNTYSGKK